MSLDGIFGTPKQVLQRTTLRDMAYGADAMWGECLENPNYKHDLSNYGDFARWNATTVKNVAAAILVGPEKYRKEYFKILKEYSEWMEQPLTFTYSD